MDKDKPIPKEWWDWLKQPPLDYRKMYGDALEFDSLDRYYQKLYELKQQEKANV